MSSQRANKKLLRYSSKQAFEEFDQWHRLPQISKRYKNGVKLFTVLAMIGTAYIGIFMVDYSNGDPNVGHAFSKVCNV
jgi:hypothetical protein